MTACESLVPARLGGRLAARLIDLVVAAATMFIASIVGGVLAVMVMFNSSGGKADTAFLGYLVTAAVLAVHAAYEVLLTVRYGSTVGKAMAGIIIVHSDSGQRLGAGPALGRHLALHVPPTVGCAVAVSQFEPADIAAWAAIAAGVGCWALIGASAAWDPQRRGWHDKLASTIVATADSVPADPPTPPPQPQAPANPPAPPATTDSGPESWGLVSDYYAPTGKHPPKRPSEPRNRRS